MKGIASHWVWILAGLIISSFLFLTFFNLLNNFKQNYYHSILEKDLVKINNKISEGCQLDYLNTTIKVKVPYTTKGIYMGLENLLCVESNKATCKKTACDVYIYPLTFSDDFMKYLSFYEGTDIFTYNLHLEKSNSTIIGTWSFSKE